AKQIFVLMTHTTKEGVPKLVREITYPATARGACTRVYTDLAVLAVADGTFIVEDMVDGMTLAELQKRTDAPLKAQ
ncbi:MAG: CoA-transferase, partial [Hyphomicrobiaceae bacterium]